MQVSGRPLLVLAVWSLVALPRAAADPPEAPTRLRAAEIAFAPLARLTRTVMRHELDVLLSPAGLGLSWRRSRPSDETAADELHAFYLTRGRPALDDGCVSALADGARAWLSAGGSPRTALGRAPGAGAPGPAPLAFSRRYR